MYPPPLNPPPCWRMRSTAAQVNLVSRFTRRIAMRIKYWIVIAALTVPLAFAQEPPPPPPGMPRPLEMMGRQDSMRVHRETGKWWKDSELAKKLQLSDKQIAQLDQTFYDH